MIGCTAPSRRPTRRVLPGFHLPRLYRELTLIRHVLVAAPATPAKVRTRGLDSIRRGFLDGNHFGFAKAFLLPQHPGGHRFTRDGERNEIDLAFVPRHTLAAKSDVPDFECSAIQTSSIGKKRLPPAEGGSLRKDLKRVTKRCSIQHLPGSGFKAQLRREFFIATVDPGNIAAIRRLVGAAICRNGNEHLPYTGAFAEEEGPRPALSRRRPSRYHLRNS